MDVKPGYKQSEVGVIPETWEAVRIGSIASFTSGQGINVALLAEESSDTPIPAYGGNGIAGYTTDPLIREPTVVVGRVGQKCGEVYLTQGPAWVTDNALYPRRFLRTPDVRFLASAMKAAGLNSVKNRNDLPLVTQAILHSVVIPVPTDVAEQRAIATALSDVDALLDKLERLIAKKRDLKKAAMQQLVTGQTRLPGYQGAWEAKRLGELIRRLPKTSRPSAAGRPEGKYPFFTNSTRPCDKYLDEADFNTEAIIANTGGEAYFNYCDGAFAAMADCFVFESQIETRFLYFVLKTMEQRINDTGFTGSGIRHLDKKFFADIHLTLPPSAEEQTSIANVLSDMGAELAALESRRRKSGDLKQAIMRELLTGKTRLVPEGATDA